MEPGKNFRNHHGKLRNQLTLADIKIKSDAICRKLLLSDWYADARTIYAFYPLGKEVDCRAFLLQAITDGKRVALPRTGLAYDMEFYEIHSFHDLEAGSFHVMEPKEYCNRLQETEAVVIVPGLVFDLEGNRYGYGKGYYDRYFARFTNLNRYAVALEQQVEQRIPVQDTDVKMHRLYTENQTYIFEKM